MLRSAAWATTWTVLRLATALLLAAAVITQAESTIGAAISHGRDVATITANFFSFFTIDSNVLAAVALAWAAVWSWTGGRDAGATRSDRPEPRALALTLASATTYMIVTGIVYNTLLRGIALPIEAVPWTNEALHVIGPLFLVADLFLAPRRRCLGWGAIAVVLLFPLAWVVYTLTRGPSITNPLNAQPYWYPYPFLNPHNFANGYVTVAVYVVGIAVTIGAVATIVVWVGRRRGLPRRPAVTRRG
jgi:hypothetical protein